MVTQRERKLLEAAEEVCAKWSVIQAADGRMGAQGLPTALRRLARALDQYDDEEALADTEKAQ